MENSRTNKRKACKLRAARSVGTRNHGVRIRSLYSVQQPFECRAAVATATCTATSKDDMDSIKISPKANCFSLYIISSWTEAVLHFMDSDGKI